MRTIYIVSCSMASPSQHLHADFLCQHFSIPGSLRSGSVGTRRRWQAFAKPDASWNVLDSKWANDTMPMPFICQRWSCPPPFLMLYRVCPIVPLCQHRRPWKVQMALSWPHEARPNGRNSHQKWRDIKVGYSSTQGLDPKPPRFRVPNQPVLHTGCLGTDLGAKWAPNGTQKRAKWAPNGAQALQFASSGAQVAQTGAQDETIDRQTNARLYVHFWHPKSVICLSVLGPIPGTFGHP